MKLRQKQSNVIMTDIQICRWFACGLCSHKMHRIDRRAKVNHMLPFSYGLPPSSPFCISLSGIMRPAWIAIVLPIICSYSERTFLFVRIITCERMFVKKKQKNTNKGLHFPRTYVTIITALSIYRDRKEETAVWHRERLAISREKFLNILKK